MAKAAVQYACRECGYSAGRWFGKCPGCNAFGTLVEEAPAGGSRARPPSRCSGSPRSSRARPRDLDRRAELDRVLGGGLVPASLVLVGGEPGVGKSTLLLARARRDVAQARRALLVTGEESAAQVKLRAERLGGAEHVEILAETELDAVCATLERERPDVCVIDSVQTLYSAELGSAPGSVAQVREAASRLLRLAKESGVATILVGHVTKDGTVAGPRVLEHLVDCVLQFEGDRYHAHRILRAVKNRFGSTNELGVFEMTGAGLEGVPDPSELFGRTLPGDLGERSPARWKGRGQSARDPGARGTDRPGDAPPRRDGVDPKRLDTSPTSSTSSSIGTSSPRTWPAEGTAGRHAAPSRIVTPRVRATTPRPVDPLSLRRRANHAGRVPRLLPHGVPPQSGRALRRRGAAAHLPAE